MGTKKKMKTERGVEGFLRKAITKPRNPKWEETEQPRATKARS